MDLNVHLWVRAAGRLQRPVFCAGSTDDLPSASKSPGPLARSRAHPSLGSDGVGCFFVNLRSTVDLDRLRLGLCGA